MKVLKKKLINSSVALIMGVGLFYGFNSSLLASDRWTSWESLRGKGVTACSRSHAEKKARNLCKKNLYKGEKVVRVDLDDYDVVYGRTGFPSNKRYCNYFANYRCKIRTNYGNNSSGSGYPSNNCIAYGLTSGCAPATENQLPIGFGLHGVQISAKILLTPLNIRQRKSVSSPVVGRIESKSCHYISNCSKVNGKIWCQVGNNGFIVKKVFYKNRWRHTFKYGCN